MEKREKKKKKGKTGKVCKEGRKVLVDGGIKARLSPSKVCI